jgi:hypothetical protein
LYRLPQQWCDYDPQKRQFARAPVLPPSALPKPAKTAKEHKEPAPDNDKARTVPAQEGPALPTNGAELQRRLYDYDARLARQGVCKTGDLVKQVVQAGVQAGYEADLATWSGLAISFAVEQTRAFESQARQQASQRKEVA